MTTISPTDSHGLATGTKLINRHTGDPTTVKELERDTDGVWWVTLNWNQAPGRPVDVGSRIDVLLEHWER